MPGALEVVLNVIFNEMSYYKFCNWELRACKKNHKHATSQSSARFIVAYTSVNDLKVMKSEARH